MIRLAVSAFLVWCLGGIGYAFAGYLQQTYHFKSWIFSVSGMVFMGIALAIQLMINHYE